ncbi:MAG: hypothetical protein J7501_10530 [Bdellovibrio sp.]|nr:hypothetical protein [Bdellovibrio sp.]
MFKYMIISNNVSNIIVFKKLSEELSRLIEKEGWLVRPYASSQLKHFMSLEKEEQNWVIHRLEDYLAICKKVHRAGRPLKDARFLVEEGLRHYNFSCDLKVESIIKPSYVVEFYGKDHRQIFRTFNYFEFTSYTLEEIYCRPWYVLYQRDEEVTRQLIESVEPIIEDQIMDPVFFDMPEHSIDERTSLEKLRMMAKEIAVTPLVQTKKLVGYLNVIQVRLAD